MDTRAIGGCSPEAAICARGIVRGRGTDTLEYEFVVRDADIEVGDLVITSGLGGVYPKGLRIGRVTALSDPGSDLSSGEHPLVGRLRQRGR